MDRQRVVAVALSLWAVTLVGTLVGCSGSPSGSVEQDPIDEPTLSLSGVVVSNVTDRGAVLSWESNNLATSEVTYSGGGGPSQTVSNGTLTSTHVIVLTGLLPETTYTYTLSSQDSSGNRETTPTSQFTTLAPAAASRFVVMDFEDGVLHDEAWLLSQPDDHVDFFVGPKRSEAPDLDVLTLAVGEGRNGGNAMLVEAPTAASWLPSFWVFKSRNSRGAYTARLNDESAYMVPYGQRANRLSFWLRFEEGFRRNWGAGEPPQYPFHQNLHVGTYHFDPRRIGPTYPGDGNGVVESDNWHFYHQVVLRHDSANGDWIHVVLNQFPQHIRNYSGSTPPNNPTELAGGYWELLTRFYVDNYPYDSDPETPYPVRMWVDDIEFLYVEEDPGMSITFGGIPDQPVPGLGAFEVPLGTERAFSVLFANTGSRDLYGTITDTSHKDLDVVLTDFGGAPIAMDDYFLPIGSSQLLTLTIHPRLSMVTGRDEYVGLSFTAHDQITPDPDIPSDAASVSFSSPYVERRWQPQTGPQDAVVAGDHFRVVLVD